MNVRTTVVPSAASTVAVTVAGSDAEKGSGMDSLMPSPFGVTTGGSPLAGLRTGIAWATAAVATPGTGVPAPDRVRPDDVRITEAAAAALTHLENA